MTIFFYIACFILGIFVGRLYGWMKYHYPEFKEEMALRVARKRLQRARVEADEAEERMRIDKLYDSQISKTRKKTKQIGSGSTKVW